MGQTTLLQKVKKESEKAWIEYGWLLMLLNILTATIFLYAILKKGVNNGR